MHRRLTIRLSSCWGSLGGLPYRWRPDSTTSYAWFPFKRPNRLPFIPIRVSRALHWLWRTSRGHGVPNSCSHKCSGTSGYSDSHADHRYPYCRPDDISDAGANLSDGSADSHADCPDRSTHKYTNQLPHGKLSHLRACFLLLSNENVCAWRRAHLPCPQHQPQHLRGCVL